MKWFILFLGWIFGSSQGEVATPIDDEQAFDRRWEKKTSFNLHDLY